MKKALKIIGLSLLVIILGLNLFVILSGRFYLYKGVADTYLKGRTIPAIDEYKMNQALARNGHLLRTIIKYL
jgi:hypothetical protein